MDLSTQYNTPLTPEEEAAFQGWAQAHKRADDLYDYDLRGWWKENGSQDLGTAHLTDTYKKPNHPTFSNESKYHGVDGLEGGSWTGDEKKGYSYQPGRTNLEYYTPQMLQNYFERVEPGVQLVMPR